MTNTLKVSLTPSQYKFSQLTDLYTMFCGGLGSGKSYTMGFIGAQDIQLGSECTIGVYEPEKKHIRTVAMPNFKHWLTEFGLSYTANKTDGAIYVHTPGVGDVLFFPMDDPDTLVGYETFRAHIDELDTLPHQKAAEMYARIGSRNRANPPDLPKSEMIWDKKKGKLVAANRIRVYSTPEGYKFCQSVWDRQEQLENHNIVRASTYENPEISSQYIDNLKQRFTERQLDAYLNGKFVNMTSHTVYYAFDRKIHNSTEKVIPGEDLHIGMDFNVNQMAAVVLVNRKGGQEYHAVDEFHGMRDTPDLIRTILSKYGHQNRIIVYPDSNDKGRSAANSSITSRAALEEAGFRVEVPSKNPLVVDRVSLVNKSFENKRLFVNHLMCPQMTMCLEQQAYTEKGEPEKRTGKDHMNDALGYAVYQLMPVYQQAFNLDFNFLF